MRYVAKICDTLFTELEVGQANKKSEAWAMCIKAAHKAKIENKCIIPSFPLCIPCIFDCIKEVTLFDEKYYVDNLSKN